MNDNSFIITMVLTIILGILLLVSLICFSMYKYEQIKIENFENTINELSDEQKCMHICGFRFSSNTYFENYKFCLEKCDRISERASEECLLK